MSMSSYLLAAVLIPLAGAAMIGPVAGIGKQAAKWFALCVTLITLAMAAHVVWYFQPAASLDGAHAASEFSWLGGTGIDVKLSLGLDGLSVWMFGLSALLMVTAVLVSWQAITDRPALFYGMLLLLEAGCLGVFAARDLLLFYVFFEFTLIPLFFLIGIWGSEDRRYAATKFFIFTLAGSLLTFLGLLSIVFWDYAQQPEGQRVLTFSIAALTESLAANPMSSTMQLIVFLALFAGFAIKVPLFPLHTWLPLAHVQAPTAGSVILAGILLKIGTYGFLRFSIPMLPVAAATCMPWLMWLSVAGIIYGALVALAQSDMKRLIAYSSVSHLGFCMLGLFALNPLASQGAALQMINHGISTGGLFALVGMLYERYHTRDISKLSGLSRRLPWLAFFMLLFTFSSIGLPGMNGFAGEVMVLIGTFQRGWVDAPVGIAWQLKVISVLAVSGVVLGAWYMLWLVQRVFFGPLKEPQGGESVRDLSLREILALTPLAILVFWIGLRPGFFLEKMAPSVDTATAAAANACYAVHSPQSTPALTEAISRVD